MKAGLVFKEFFMQLFADSEHDYELITFIHSFIHS